MGDDHVAIGAGLLVEGDAVADIEQLGHVDLHVVDEIAVPDRLKEAIGEAEGEDVLRRLLAEEMVDAEDLVLGEDRVQLSVQRLGAFEIRAERLFHHDMRALDEFGLVEHAHGGERGVRRHAEIMEELVVAFAGDHRPVDGRPQRARAGLERQVVEARLELGPRVHPRRPIVLALDRLAGDGAKGLDVDVVEGNADDVAAAG